MSEEIRVTVAMDGSGDFRNVQAAVDSLSGSQPAVILIKRGCYRERVVIHHSNVRLVGEDREETVITWSACAKDPNPDGSERGTFLSYTLLTAAPDITVENLTVRNDLPAIAELRRGRPAHPDHLSAPGSFNPVPECLV